MTTDMSPSFTNVATLIQHLIETCEAGAKGFREAADLVEDTGIRATFRELGDEREQLAAELHELAARYGADSPQTGMVKAAAHRAWMRLKDMVTGDDHAVISAAEEGEDYALEQYDEALAETLPAEVQTVVSRQRGVVKAAHDRVRALENLTE